MTRSFTGRRLHRAAYCEEMVMVFMAQLVPASGFSRLRQLVYQALVD